MLTECVPLDSTLTLNPPMVAEGDVIMACVSFVVAPSAKISVLIFTRDPNVGGATSET